MAYVRWRERLTVPDYDVELGGKVEIDPERCNGCGYCALICPGNSIRVEGRGGDRKARFVVDSLSMCMSCNDCAAICDRDAVFVTVPYDFGGYYRVIHRGAFEPPRNF